MLRSLMNISGTKRPKSHLDSIIFVPDDKELSAAIFGRRRLLGAIGQAIFGGIAIMLVRSSPAYATVCNPDYVDSPCWGGTKCNCCSAYSCCSSGCTPAGGSCRLGSDTNYWMTCRGDYMYVCADFIQSCSNRRDFCICRFYAGTC